MCATPGLQSEFLPASRKPVVVTSCATPTTAVKWPDDCSAPRSLAVRMTRGGSLKLAVTSTHYQSPGSQSGWKRLGNST